MKKKLVVLLAIVMSLSLAGCKPSEEKLSEIEGYKTQLQAKRAEAEEKYLDIADTSLRPELDALGVQVSEVEKIDFSKLSNKKIDEKSPELLLLLGQYDDVLKKLDGTYQQESAVNNELAKNVEIDAYFINKTGFEITSIILHDMTTDNYSDNLIGDGEVFSDGYTLMGVKLEIHTDSDAWEFLVKDINDTQRQFSCESLKEASQDGVSMVFDYDNESELGRVTFGGYFTN